MEKTPQKTTRRTSRRRFACLTIPCGIAWAVLVLGCESANDSQPAAQDASSSSEKAATAETEPAPTEKPAKPETATPIVSAAPKSPWVHWRGPLQTGVAIDRDLPETWSQDGENLVWHQPYGGRSCPVAVDGRVCMIGVVGKGIDTQERVACFDAQTGTPLWEHRFNVFHTDIVANRVGWANLAADPETGYVYAHGVQDLLLCLDAEGKEVWSRSLKEEFGAVTGYGGRIHTPVLDEDRLIISFLSSSWGKQGPPRHRYLALDKRRGKVLWWVEPGGQPEDTTYSTPVFAVIGGQRLMIAGNADGNVYAMKARTGETVWTFKLSKRGINSSFVVDGDRVYASHGEENLDSTAMGRLVCIDGSGHGDVTKTHEIWRYDGLEMGYSSPALQAGRLYVSDNSANLHCVDAATGKLIWRHKLGKVGRGSTPVWADGKLYVTEEKSFHILKPGDKQCESLDVEQFSSDKGPVEIYGSPAVAGGRVYFTTTDAIYALGLKSWSGKTDPLPAALAEEPAAADAQPAILKVVPGEVTLAPGETASFEVQAYDDHGRKLRNVQAEFSLAGLRGELAEGGSFHTPVENVGQAGEVQAKVGALTATARVRVLPTLPYQEDFEKSPPDGVPPHWITSRAKFGVRELEGNKLLRKTNVNPSAPVARAIAFIGPPQASGYTIQADCMGTEVRAQLPEMGVVNSRYSLVLMGTDEQLVINAWDALPRLEKTIDFPMEPNVWYRMKLRVDVESQRAVVRGKVWSREGEEPQEWTIEAEDPMPNRAGSPGLHAYSSAILEDSPGAEVFFDNVRVEPNEP